MMYSLIENFWTNKSISYHFFQSIEIFIDEFYESLRENSLVDIIK